MHDQWRKNVIQTNIKDNMTVTNSRSQGEHRDVYKKNTYLYTFTDIRIYFMQRHATTEDVRA